MLSRGNHTQAISKTRFFSALMITVAAIVLIVSCPLKRLLVNNFVSQRSVSSRSNQTNINQPANIFNNSNKSCFVFKSKTTVVNAGVSQQYKIIAPVFTFNIFDHTGYWLQSFLNRASPFYKTVSCADISPLPLFLRHRSILI